MMRAVISLGLIFAVLLPIAESTERIVAQVEHSSLETKEAIYRLQWGGARPLKEDLETNPNSKHLFVCIGENKIEGPFKSWPTCFFGIVNEKLLTQSELTALLPKLESESSWKKLGFASVGPHRNLETKSLTVILDHDSSLQLLKDFSYQKPSEDQPTETFQTDSIECLKKFRKTRTRGGSSTFGHNRWRCSMSLQPETH
jgi:hypothetical protein